MTHCEKCIHYELCKSRMDVAPDDTFSFFPDNEDCPHFKNKTDYAEVEHGEWIQEWELEKCFEDNDEIPYIKCSLCGHMEWGIDKERDITPDYCSDCGAKMDEKA